MFTSSDFGSALIGVMIQFQVIHFWNMPFLFFMTCTPSVHQLEASFSFCTSSGMFFCGADNSFVKELSTDSHQCLTTASPFIMKIKTI